ncbi:hypothetical protein [Actinomarinicola tropica]|uniref:Flagellar biosynthesis protein FlhF n=1 Tax=Actinomarinicola tropica TaxID=2789776 RepID=A0A5Q2RLD0_9ACTN|nr:hypothetical protein [Actinomarinicola tropica]QGG94660.1 hypothetical protein GH723_05800 [Actinomarinicola tropica]
MSTHLKFDGPHLEEVLERVGRELGPRAVIVEANKTRRGGVGGFFSKEWYEVVVAAPAEEPAATDDELAIEDPLLALADAVQDEVAPRRSPAPEPVREETFAEVLARAGVGERLSPGTSSLTAPPAPALPTAPVASAMPAPVAPVAQAAEVALRDLPLGEMLARLDALVPRTTLPTAAGAVIAVVGDLRVARAAAAALAVRLGAGEADVMIATPEARDAVSPWLRIDGPDVAAARAARWRRGEHPVVVAVDLTPGREGHAWAASVLEALDADQVRLVARAWQVTDELAPKAAVLGGVDGIELVELEAAAEPEAFLALDLPVVGIDGRPATSEMWAALMMERRHDATA